MAKVTEEQVRDALSGVTAPGGNGNLAVLELVSGVVVRDGNVGFTIEVTSKQAQTFEPVRKAAEEAVAALPGVISVTAVLTAERPRQQQRPQQEHGQGPAQGQPQTSLKELVPNVGAIVAVASGKGGVGKSTIAINLALALLAKGLKVGLLDADIYGPSIPKMLGVHGRPDSEDGNILEPKENYGLKCMSIGFLVAEDTPMIWRGPMVMSAIEQLLRDVNWGELDILVIDLPPGTGDAQLTIAQRVPLTGALIVSTPQDIALLDARKSLNMFRKVEVPVLGIIENMSYFACPHCGERTDIFSHGGAKATAAEMGADFLGEIPLDMDIREAGDAGKPITAADSDSPHSKAFLAIADEVWEKARVLSEEAEEQAPKIIVQ